MTHALLNIAHIEIGATALPTPPVAPATAAGVSLLLEATAQFKDVLLSAALPTLPEGELPTAGDAAVAQILLPMSADTIPTQLPVATAPQTPALESSPEQESDSPVVEAPLEAMTAPMLAFVAPLNVTKLPVTPSATSAQPSLSGIEMRHDAVVAIAEGTGASKSSTAAATMLPSQVTDATEPFPIKLKLTGIFAENHALSAFTRETNNVALERLTTSQPLQWSLDNVAVIRTASGEPIMIPKDSGTPQAGAPQSLAAALGERLQVQLSQRSEHTVIRLDPPSMGTIEIVIRHEAGGLQVKMHASNSEVARQLHAVSDTLRQDLVQRQHGDVSVQVYDAARDSDGRHKQRQAAFVEEQPGRALNEADDGAGATRFAMDSEQRA